MSGVTPEISASEALLALLARPITQADRSRAALHVLDWLGCALVGRMEPVGRAMTLQAAGDPLAMAGGPDPSLAAMVMGGLGSLLEMDDVHKAALLHPGPVVIAAALAVPGDGDLLDAILRGYEVMIRLGRAVGPAHYARFHNTATCGGIGAAVAAASRMKLDDAATIHAIGHAVSLSGGLWQCRNEKVETKHLHVSEAARRGVQAALHARAGLAGPRFILEGPHGFFAGMAPDGDPARMLAPANDWLIHEVSFKPWPACRHAHAAIDAALALRAGIEAPITAIHVRSYRDALVFCDRAEPRTAAEARFSLQHAVAVALAEGPPSPGAFDPARLPEFAGLRAMTEVEEAPELTAAYPARFGAEVEIATADGTRHLHRVEDAWGDPENPMDITAISAKFHRLAKAAGLDAGTAEGLEAALARLTTQGEDAPFLAALRRMPQPQDQD